MRKRGAGKARARWYRQRSSRGGGQGGRGGGQDGRGGGRGGRGGASGRGGRSGWGDRAPKYKNLYVYF